MSNTTSKNLASTRIATLLDEGSFVEIGGAVTARATDFNMQEKETPADGVITGYGAVSYTHLDVYKRQFEAKRVLRMEISKEQMPVYCEGEEIFISIAAEKILFLGGESTWEYQ